MTDSEQKAAARQHPYLAMVFPWLVSLVLAAIVVVLVLRGLPAPPDPEAKAKDKFPPTKSTGATWEAWPEGEHAAKMMGYQDVRAFRWQRGLLDGWVRYFEGDEVKRKEFHVYEHLDGAKRPEDLAGRIIIALRENAPAVGEQELHIYYSLEHREEPVEGLATSMGSLTVPWKRGGKGQQTNQFGDTFQFFESSGLSTKEEVEQNHQFLEFKIRKPRGSESDKSSK